MGAFSNLAAQVRQCIPNPPDSWVSEEASRPANTGLRGVLVSWVLEVVEVYLTQKRQKKRFFPLSTKRLKSDQKETL